MRKSFSPGIRKTRESCSDYAGFFDVDNSGMPLLYHCKFRGLHSHLATCYQGCCDDRIKGVAFQVSYQIGLFGLLEKKSSENFDYLPKKFLFHLHDSIRTSQKEMGKLAMDTMAARQQRWRERSNRGFKLKTSHTVNSAVEMAINEENEGNESMPRL